MLTSLLAKDFLDFFLLSSFALFIAIVLYSLIFKSAE